MAAAGATVEVDTTMVPQTSRPATRDYDRTAIDMAIVNSIVKVVSERFVDAWSQLPTERQDQFRKDVQRVIASQPLDIYDKFRAMSRPTVRPRVAPTVKDLQGTPNKGKGERTKTTRDALQFSLDRRIENKDSPSRPRKASEKPNELKQDRKKKEIEKRDTAPYAQNVKKDRKPSNKSNMFDKVFYPKEKNTGKPEFKQTEISGDDFSTRLHNDVLQFLGELASFVENHRQIPIYSIPKENNGDGKIKGRYTEKISRKKLQEIKTARNTLIDLTNKIINSLTWLCHNKIPKPANIMSEPTAINGEVVSEKDPALKMAVNRIVGKITDTLDPKPQEIQEDLLPQGFHVQLLKNHLLGAIWYSSTRTYNATSLLISCYLSLEVENKFCSLHLLTLMETTNSLVRQLINHVETFNWILNWEREHPMKLPEDLDDNSDKKSRKKKGESLVKEIPPQMITNIDIWNLTEDENRIEESTTSEKRWLGGTLYNLILRVTPDDANSAPQGDFMETFLNLYPAYTTPHEIFHKVSARFNTPKTLEPQHRSFIKMRVVKFLIVWIKRDYHRFDPVLLEDIRKFVINDLHTDTSITAAKALATSILDELANEQRFYHKTVAFCPKEIHIYTTGSPAHRIKALQQYTHQQIADHLTQIELEIYRRIQFYELLDLKWSKQRLRIMAVHLLSWIERADMLSFWIATMILLQPTVRDRAKALTLFINVAQQLLECSNLNGLMTVLNGLSMSSISRLHVAWSQIPKKAAETYEALNAIQSPSAAFATLRKTMDKCGKCIPPLALHLSDLTGTYENTDTITTEHSGEHPIINILKHSIISRLISRLLNAQNSYKSGDALPKVDALYTFLSELPALNETELFQLSLEQEPRGCQAKDLV